MAGIGFLFDFYASVMAPKTIASGWRRLLRQHESLELQRGDHHIGPFTQKLARPFYAFMVQLLSHYNVDVRMNELFTISFFLNSYGLSSRGMNFLAQFDRCLTDRSYRRQRKELYHILDGFYRSFAFHCPYPFIVLMSE